MMSMHPERLLRDFDACCPSLPLRRHTCRKLLFAVLGTLLILPSVRGTAQKAAATKPAFEVATIKLNLSDCCTSSRWSADQVSFSNQTLMHLVIFAYNLQPMELVCPDWMKTIRFDVTAKYAPGTKLADRLLMLQTLLAERFKLTVQRDTREMQAYELLTAPNGFKLKPVEPGEGSYNSGEQDGVRSFRARKISMSDLAYDLADSLGEPVVDRTGLDGMYDFELTWAADDLRTTQTENTKSASSLFTAMQETLGLRLLHRKTIVPVVVVTHAERTPSEN